MIAQQTLNGLVLGGVYALGGDVMIAIGGKAVLFLRAPTPQAPAVADPAASPPIR